MALDKNTGDSLFGGLKGKPQHENQQKPVSSDQECELNKQVSNTPKWETLDKVTVLLTPEQKDGLDHIAKKIMKHRSKTLKGHDSKERITTNTLIRALVENFLTNESSLEMKVLASENRVHEWIKELFK